MTNKNIKDNYPYENLEYDNFNYYKSVLNNSKKKKVAPIFGLERVEIHPTSNCQYKCSFCYGKNFKNRNKSELSLSYIDNNILKPIIRNKNLLKHDPIIILAGLFSEPLLYSEIDALINLLGKYKLRFAVYTNGLSLNNSLSEIICNNALQIGGSSKCYISFNISASILHDNYSLLLKKIKFFLKIRNKMKAPIIINLPILIENDLLSKINLPKIQKDLLKISVDRIRYSIPQKPINLISLKLKYANLITKLKKDGGDKVYIRSRSGKHFDKCFVALNTISIDSFGNVYPCSQTCSKIFNKLSYGSIKKDKISEIWYNKKHMALYNNFVNIRCYCRCNHADNQFNSILSFFDKNLIK